MRKVENWSETYSFALAKYGPQGVRFSESTLGYAESFAWSDAYMSSLHGLRGLAHVSTSHSESSAALKSLIAVKFRSTQTEKKRVTKSPTHSIRDMKYRSASNSAENGNLIDVQLKSPLGIVFEMDAEIQTTTSPLHNFTGISLTYVKSQRQ